MRKKYFILAFTFLCLLVGQNNYGQTSGGDYGWDIDLDDVCVGSGCDDDDDWGDSGDPCDVLSNAYDPVDCAGSNGPYDSGDPCDPSSNSYSPYQCGGDTGDPCDPYSYAYNYWNCNFWDTDEPSNPDNPCDFATTQAAIGASTFFANHALQLSNNFSPFSTNPNINQNEESFIIADINGEITSGSIDINGEFNSGEIKTLGPNGGSFKITTHTIADVHTHPSHGKGTPSAEDIVALAKAKTDSPNFSNSYIIASDGTKYSLHISDVSKLNTFAQVNGDFSDANNGFNIYTPIGADFHHMVDSFKNNNNMTDAEANERALAYVLKDSGIHLLKAQPGSNDFKKIDVKPAKNPDGTEKIDAAGYPIFEKVDCL